MLNKLLKVTVSAEFDRIYLKSYNFDYLKFFITEY